MGFIEDVQAMDLSDDDKQVLIEKHRSEVDPLRQTNESLSARTKKDTVEAEVVALADAGFKDQPGLLKYYRRCLLSPDAEEPGAVLLSDTEMELSGDQATGATGREEVSVATALRTFVKLMLNDDGKLAVDLSDIATATDDDDRPDAGDNDPTKRTEEARSNLSNLTGKDLTRKSRSKRYRTATVTGGGE